MTPKLETALDAIVAGARGPAASFHVRSKQLMAVNDALTDADRPTLALAATRLIPALQADDPNAGGIVAMALGSLLETGADTAPIAAPLRAAATRWMNEAAAFAETWRAGPPSDSDAAPTWVEAPHAQVIGRVIVEDERSVQAWAARHPLGARAWGCLDDWFLPLMALARFDPAGVDAIRGDAVLVAAFRRLTTADPNLCVTLDYGNSHAGGFIRGVIEHGQLPDFADEY